MIGARLVFAALAIAPLPAIAQPDLPDMPGTGAYPAIREPVAGLPDHILYRPADLAHLKRRRLGLYLWGNAACRGDAASARQHLLEIASHGYLAIAAGTARSGPGGVAVPPNPVAADGSFRVETNVADVRAGLDWALAENARRGSFLYHRIDPAKIATAGQSCGGLQAIQVGADPRVRTVVLLNSGTIPAGVANPLREIVSDASVLDGLHTPVLVVLGGARDIAYPYGVADFGRLRHLPAVMANIDTGHAGTTAEPSGGAVAALVVDWLAWQLDGDGQAKARFVGPDCGYCRDPRWTLERRNMKGDGE